MVRTVACFVMFTVVSAGPILSAAEQGHAPRGIQRASVIERLPGLEPRNTELLWRGVVGYSAAQESCDDFLAPIDYLYFEQNGRPGPAFWRGTDFMQRCGYPDGSSLTKAHVLINFFGLIFSQYESAAMDGITSFLGYIGGDRTGPGWRAVCTTNDVGSTPYRSLHRATFGNPRFGGTRDPESRVSAGGNTRHQRAVLRQLAALMSARCPVRFPMGRVH